MIQPRRGAGALALLALTLGTGGCWGDDSPSVSARGEVVVERADGSRVTFRGPLRAWCAPWGHGFLGHALHVGTYDPEDPKASFWILYVNEAELGSPTRFRFPNSPFDRGVRPRGALLFVNDTPLDNELSTDQVGAAGAATVEAAACEVDQDVSVDVDATLGSEYEGGPSVTARGRVSVTIGEPIKLP
jgi:hypothetical protein